MKNKHAGWLSVMGLLFVTMAFAGESTYRLYPGIAVYVNNPAGKDFEITLDVRDINIYENGPREVLVKVYTPDGVPVVREYIPDDGVEKAVFTERIAGWDQQLQYTAIQQIGGFVPTIRASAFSDQARLKTLVKRTFTYPIKGAGRGIYRIVLTGTLDNYVTLRLSPELKYGVAGHHAWVYGSGDQFRESYIYIPTNTTGLHVAFAEPDTPLSRQFTLTASDGRVLCSSMATGGFKAITGKAWPDVEKGFDKLGHSGKLLKLSVSPGANDFQVCVVLKQPFAGVFKDYIGMGSLAILAPDPETAMVIRGGTIEVDDELFWHPFQVRFHNWLKTHPLDANDSEKSLRKDLETLEKRFRLIGVGDHRGAMGWNNLAYSFGYAGCKIWRFSWVLLQRKDIPDDVRAIILEGLILAGDRYGFTHEIERTNGNSFNQISIALWYAYQATGDKMLQERFETFWNRWATGGWGAGVGLTPSGDHHEIFAHAWHYMSYLMNNWRVGGYQMYVEGEKGIVGDATNDTRFTRVLDRNRELFSYLWCREPRKRGITSMAIASPWSSRTDTHPVNLEENWEPFGHPWKGDPGPDMTVSVNDGNEWFAARRSNYYMLTYHGRITPAWVSKIMAGQVGFGGGTICQLTIPGKGPVLTGSVNGHYGVGMHPSNWRNFHIHSLVGETWDGRPLISGISEHSDVKLTGNVLTSSGQVRDTNVKVARKYTFNDDNIDCEVALADSDYKEVLSLWTQPRKWSEVRLAYEMIPFGITNIRVTNTVCKVTVTGSDGKDVELGDTLVETKVVRIDRGDFGVRILLPEPRPVMRGANKTVMIQITDKEVSAADIKLGYRLVPYRN
jgi:hypothetical protein